jgi:hypothetical protein
MMQGGHGILGLAAAAIVTMASAGPAHAVEIGQLLGRWSAPDLEECQYADDSEGAPLQIRREQGETLIGKYGWLCSVKDWKTDGDFLTGTSKGCGQEGDGETFDTDFRIGLNAQDQLMMVDGDITNIYRRCPAAP